MGGGAPPVSYNTENFSQSLVSYQKAGSMYLYSKAVKCMKLILVLILSHFVRIDCVEVEFMLWS